MRVDAPWTRLPGVARLLRLWSVKPGLARSRCRATRPFLTPEQFQEELAILGLSGRNFGPEEYMEALSDYLGISVAIHVIPDERRPELSQRLALSGRLGEVRYSEELGLAAIFPVACPRSFRTLRSSTSSVILPPGISWSLRVPARVAPGRCGGGGWLASCPSPRRRSGSTRRT